MAISAIHSNARNAMLPHEMAASSLRRHELQLATIAAGNQVNRTPSPGLANTFGPQAPTGPPGTGLPAASNFDTSGINNPNPEFLQTAPQIGGQSVGNNLSLLQNRPPQRRGQDRLSQFMDRQTPRAF